MQQIREIQLQEFDQSQQLSGSASLTIRSGPPLPEGMGLALSVMMAEVQARYSNQVLPEGTPDMYLVEWEKLTLRHGLERFRGGLLMAIEESRFFPDPVDVAQHCKALARTEHETASTQKHLREMDAAKMQWLREYLDDVAQGIERNPLSPEMQAAARALQQREAGKKTRIHAA